MSGVRTLKVKDDDDGQRLDRWLKKNVPELPFALAQKLIRKGAIRVDGKRGKTDTRLSSGQEIRLPPLEDKPEKQKRGYKVSPDDGAKLRAMVIYDDGDVIALNKPSGIATQGGGGVEKHIDGMMELMANRKGVKPRLIHRLDRDTSGVLLLARSAEAVRRLGASFSGRHARKIYWAIVTPAPIQNDGTIKAPIGKAKGPHKDKMTVSDGEDSKTAVTDFVVIDRAGRDAAFVAFWPRTGRTHQIRVHAAEVLKCPILGDEKYGGAALEGMKMAARLHLHARRLMLAHPIKKETLDIMAPLPPELKQSWKQLGFDTDLRDDPFAE